MTYRSHLAHAPVTYQLVLLTYRSRASSSSRPSDVFLAAVPVSSIVAPTPATSSPQAAGSRKTAEKAERCRLDGCTPYRGEFQCEFRPRSGVDDEEERDKQTEDGEVNHTVKMRKVLRDGPRRCEWALRYRFVVKQARYLVVVEEGEHKGHRYRVQGPGGEEWVLEYGDLTAAMKESIHAWLRMRGSNTAMVRQVLLQHTPCAPTTYLPKT